MAPWTSFVNLCFIFLFINAFQQDVEAQVEAKGNNSSTISLSVISSTLPTGNISLSPSFMPSNSTQYLPPSSTVMSDVTSSISSNATSSISPIATSSISPNVTHTFSPNTSTHISPNSSHVHPNSTVTSPVVSGNSTTPVPSSSPPAPSSSAVPVKTTQKPTGGKSDKDYDKMKKRMWVAGGFAIVFAITTVILAYLVYRQRKINRELEGDPSTARLL